MKPVTALKIRQNTFRRVNAQLAAGRINALYAAGIYKFFAHDSATSRLM